MRVERYPTEKLKREILAIMEKYLDLAEYKVFFFGSRVAGGGNERSDIDIGIEGPAPVPPKAMFQIEEEMENLPILYKIEIVDFSKVSRDFYDVASSDREFL